MKTFVLLAYFFLLIFPQKEEKIAWRNSHQLTWQDFQEKPKTRSTFNANTNSGISYAYKLTGSPSHPYLEYTVTANFYPALSWVRPTSKTSDLLQHEQLHFDISELFARKLRKSLNQISSEQLKINPQKTLNNLYKKIEDQRVYTQEIFDKESVHGLNRVEEKKWEDRIYAELQKFKNYRITD